MIVYYVLRNTCNEFCFVDYLVAARQCDLPVVLLGQENHGLPGDGENFFFNL